MPEWLQSYETAVGGMNGDERQEKVHTLAERLIETEKWDQIIKLQPIGKLRGFLCIQYILFSYQRG